MKSRRILLANLPAEYRRQHDVDLLQRQDVLAQAIALVKARRDAYERSKQRAAERRAEDIAFVEAIVRAGGADLGMDADTCARHLLELLGYGGRR